MSVGFPLNTQSQAVHLGFYFDVLVQTYFILIFLMLSPSNSVFLSVSPCNVHLISPMYPTPSLPLPQISCCLCTPLFCASLSLPSCLLPCYMFCVFALTRASTWYINKLINCILYITRYVTIMRHSSTLGKHRKLITPLY